MRISHLGSVVTSDEHISSPGIHHLHVRESLLYLLSKKK